MLKSMHLQEGRHRSQYLDLIQDMVLLNLLKEDFKEDTIIRTQSLHSCLQGINRQRKQPTNHQCLLQLLIRIQYLFLEVESK